MAVDIKVAPDEKLELVQTYITDTSLNSDYFNISELPDTFSGGKNAFLIAGSNKLLANTEVKIQIKDSLGNIVYTEYSHGSPSEYYEGNSKICAVYVYPTLTAFGPATITILGQAKDVPQEWNGLYSVKWTTQVNINPALSNTTRVRFYKRPIVSIVEQLSPIYAFDATGSKVASLVTQSFANIKVSQLDTFAGDVKRVKVYRTAEGDISDYDLIQDILVESKELLTTTTLSGSVVGEAGLFTSETLQKLWNTGSLTTALTSSKIDNGLSLKGSGYLRYTSSLNLTNGNTYELGLDAFYSSSTASNMGIYISGSQNGAKLIGTLNGIVPTKNLTDQVFAFTLDKIEPTSSLYLSQSQSEWHVGNISLKLSEDSAFSPSEISFVTSMPTVLGNETFNFKFEFYDVNNNYVPVAVTQSALFTGGNNNIGGTLILISGSTSASNAALLELSKSVSGTIGIVTGSISQSFVTSSAYSASLQSSSLYISASISGTISNVSSSVSGTISSVSQSASSSLSLVSQSVSKSIALISSSTATTFTDVNSRIFTDATGLVNKAPSNGVAGLYLGDSYLGYHNGNGNVNGWKTFMANNGNFFLTSSNAAGGYMAWDSSAATLVIKGSIDITGGTANDRINGAATSASAASASALSASASVFTLDTKTFTDSTGKLAKTPSVSGAGLYLGSTYMGYYNGSDWKTYMSDTGNFYLSGTGTNSLTWNGSALSINGSLTTSDATIGGWSIDATRIFATNGITLDSANKQITVFDAAGAGRIYINQNATLSSLSAGTTQLGYGLASNNTGTISEGTYSKTSANTVTLTSGKTFNLKAVFTEANGTNGLTISSGQGTPISIDIWERVYIRKTAAPNTEYLIAEYKDGISFGTSVSLAAINNKQNSITIAGDGGTYEIITRVTWQAQGSYNGGVYTVSTLRFSPYDFTASPANSFVEIVAGGLQVGRDANNYVKIDRAAASGVMLEVGGEGTFTGDVTANTSSDIRLKENIVKIPNALDKILKISGNTFTWKDGFEEVHSKTGIDIGVIAQEIESILPDIVVTRHNGYKGVQYEKLVALLIEAIKELKNEIDELKNR
jgi:hypothetical protein